MKTRFPRLALACFLLIVACRTTRRPVGDGIDRTLREWHDAYAAGNTDVLTTLVTEDAEFWTHGQPAMTGRAALAAAFQQVFKDWQINQEVVIAERLVRGDLAYLRGEEINHLTNRNDHQTVVIRQRMVSILRREADGRWRFARGMTNQGSEK